MTTESKGAQRPGLVPMLLAVLAAGAAGFLIWGRGGGSQATLAIYVVGEVNNPGVVVVPAGSRVVQAIERAGGLTPEADELAINLAEKLVDEQKIVVPPKAVKVGIPGLDGSPGEAHGAQAHELETLPVEPSPPPPAEPVMTDPAEEPPVPEPASPPALLDEGPPPAEDGDQHWAGGPLEFEEGPPRREPVVTGPKIPLNSASVGELEGIPGIGPGLASKIVEYRQQAGHFEALEDLMNVPGIKLRKLEQIRPYLTL